MVEETCTYTKSNLNNLYTKEIKQNNLIIYINVVPSQNSVRHVLNIFGTNGEQFGCWNGNVKDSSTTIWLI